MLSRLIPDALCPNDIFFIMRNKRFTYLLLAFVAAVSAFGAKTVECRPGELCKLVGPEFWKVDDLTLIGSADASDLFFIGDRMSALERLDMSALAITAYAGKPLRGSASYPAAAIPAGAFAGTRLREVLLPSGLDLGEMAFGNTRLVSIVLPEGTRSVGLGAFAGCSGLENASLCGTARYDGYTFTGCRFLQRVSLNGLTTIPEAMFKDCQSLVEVDGDALVTEIGDEAFVNCTRLRSFSFGKALSGIGRKAFLYSGLENAAMGNAPADSIGAMAFMDCFDLRTVELPAQCTAVPDYAFANSGITGLLELPGVEQLGRYCLAGDVSVSSVKLPETMTILGDGAMAHMSRLENIFAGSLNSVPALGDDVFEGIDRPAVRLYAAAGMEEAFSEADVWRDFEILTATENGMDTTPVPESRLRGRIESGNLVLAAVGADIVRVDVYNAAGLPVASCVPEAESCCINLEGVAPGVVLVAATLSDGTSYSLKFVI